MSAPEFERVCRQHELLSGNSAIRRKRRFVGSFVCACGYFEHEVENVAYQNLHATHLAAALDAEVARWLAERDTARTFLDEWVRPYFGDDSDDAVACVSRVLAAALAPTDVAADEKGAGR